MQTLVLGLAVSVLVAALVYHRKYYLPLVESYVDACDKDWNTREAQLEAEYKEVMVSARELQECVEAQDALMYSGSSEFVEQIREEILAKN